MNWREYVVSPDQSIREVIQFIDDKAKLIALVLGEEDALKGTITDGDIRRGLLKGLSLEDSCEKVMNSSPKTYSNSLDSSEIKNIMKRAGIRHVPLVDEGGRVCSLVTMKDLMGKPNRDNAVFIMAGGLGKRLGELTKDCPKPMLKVGGKPILETIVDNFIDQGFHRFFFSVNYKSEIIKGYFGHGEKWNISIEYLEEDRPLGTAGSLTLHKKKEELPFIVMNGDLLTKINFNHLLNFHQDSDSIATMCVREFDIEVPFGVVELDGHELVRIDEKPLHRFFGNAGIYALNPEAISATGSGEHLDMTTLFENLIEKGSRVSSFPIHEYWRDIGRIDDFRTAYSEFGDLFTV